MRVESAVEDLAREDPEFLGGQVFGPDAIGNSEEVVGFADVAVVGVVGSFSSHGGPWLI